MSQSAHFLVVKNHVLILVMNNNIFINLENLTNKPIFPKTLMNQNSKLNHHVLINYEQQQQQIILNFNNIHDLNITQKYHIIYNLKK
jgi:hypothetical protein